MTVISPLSKAVCQEVVLSLYLTQGVTHALFFWLCQVFIAAHGLFLVTASRGYSLVPRVRASHWGGFFACGARALECTDFSITVHWLSCSAAGGICPDQGQNPCLLMQADSYPLYPREVQYSLLYDLFSSFNSTWRTRLHVSEYKIVLITA